jgi:hypothetical protein
MVSALIVALSFAQTERVELVRGRDGYWSCEDTTLEATAPDSNFGGDFVLKGGPGKIILIRFGDLEKLRNTEILSAKLVLSLSGKTPQNLKGVNRLLVPWGEGPSNTVSAVALQKGSVARVNVPWAASWAQRRGGDGALKWQQPGGLGPSDVAPIAEAKGVVEGENYQIEGLEKAVQVMVDRWFDNNGFSLQFGDECEFDSAQATSRRPKLVLEFRRKPEPRGADLSVQIIRVTPEIVPPQPSATDENGVVTYAPPKGGGPMGPAGGDVLTYTATIKNVGDMPSKPFRARWLIRERQGTEIEVPKTLQPGESMTLEFQRPYQPANDHRTNPIQLRLTQPEPDANPNNDALEVYEGGRPLVIFGDMPNLDDAQRRVRELNGTVFSQSRFSFAPNGVIERVRIQSVSSEAPARTDGVLPDNFTLADVVQALSLPTKLKTTVDFKFDGKNLGRLGEAIEPSAGSGEGDTRNESLIPGQLVIPYEPYFNPIFESFPLEATGLLSATEVASLNSNIGKPTGYAGDILFDLPATIILRALDYAGNPLTGAELTFFQSSNGKVTDSEPAFTLLTGTTGTALLPNRETPMVELPTGHTLRNNPFGKLDPLGRNGAFLVRAILNGQTEWGWLKAWQLVDAYHRGSKSAAIFEMRFNLPNIALEATNLAKGKFVSDSAEGLPAQLASLTDESLETTVALGGKVGDWIEIDLGRDRPVGEVRLFGPGQMPQKYQVVMYATGQKPDQMNPWARELDSRWTWRNRADAEVSGASVAYRSLASRVRFIRIVNVSGGVGQLTEVKVASVKVE